MKNVKILINRLENYSDQYTINLLSVFKSYLKHKDFVMMQTDVSNVQNDTFIRNKWELETRCLLSAVLYPEI